MRAHAGTAHDRRKGAFSHNRLGEDRGSLGGGKVKALPSQC
jgi:hypothetical protein